MGEVVKRNSRLGYVFLAIILFLIECYIEGYEKNNFIRFYFGDYLVVILLYAIVKMFLKTEYFITATCVLIFAYGVELLQWINIVEIFNIQKTRWVHIILGTTFSWTDMLCYTLGFLTIILVEYAIAYKKGRTKS